MSIAIRSVTIVGEDVGIAESVGDMIGGDVGEVLGVIVNEGKRDDAVGDRVTGHSSPNSFDSSEEPKSPPSATTTSS